MKNLLAANLKAYRIAHKLTQGELAEIIKKDRSSIAKYENGTAVPPLPVLRSLCALYNTSVDALCGSKTSNGYTTLHDGKKEKKVIVYAEMTKEEQMLIMKLRMLGSEKLSEIIDEVDGILNQTDQSE